MRRTFRRHIRKTLAQEIPPILQEANFAFDQGKYGCVAELFERIAETAAARNGLRAPIFYLQAGQISLGMPSLRCGLDLLKNQGYISRLQSAGARVVSELNEHRLNNEAAEIETWLETVLPTTDEVDAFAKRPILPTHCPSCGAGVRPDEVEWRDESTADCACCGSPIR